MNKNFGLAVLWAAAVIFAIGAFSAAYRSATLQAELMFSQSFVDQTQYQWASVIGQLAVPLLTTACLTVVVALIVHATLWRRAHVTQPEQPQES